LGGRAGEGRFLPPDDAAAAGTKASHEVMELVRGTPALSLVMQLRETGQFWHVVKTAIEAEIKA